MKPIQQMLWAGAALAWTVVPAHAQVTRATQSDLAPLPSFFKPDKNGQIHFNNAPIPHPKGLPEPTKNLRDLSGYYDAMNAFGDEAKATDATVIAGGGGPGGPGGPPPGGRGGPGGPPPGGFRVNSVSIAAVRGQSFNREACLPDFETGRGFNGGQILMAKDTVVLIGEMNHQHQIIYMNSQHPANFQPNRVGDSIGHWDGNTLVVDVIGVKGQGHMVERIRKLSNGSVENLITNDDGSKQVVTMHWRPDLPLLEDICEDFAEAYGKQYSAPVAPNLDSKVAK